MYSVLLGRPPFPGASALEILRRLANDPLTPPRTIDPNLPVEVEAILVKALAKNKKDRYPNAAAMADDLARYLEGKSAPASAVPAAPPAAPAAKKFNPVMVIVAVLLIAGGAWFGINSRKQQPPPSPPAPGPIVNPAVDPPPPVAAPPGSFSLSIAVHPFAEVVRVLRDGEPVTLEQKSPPFLETGLQVGAYEIVLRHPKLGEKTIKLPKESLKAGKTYVIWGTMDASLSVSEAP
jgi:serine/threonine protein kinase